MQSNKNYLHLYERKRFTTKLFIFYHKRERFFLFFSSFHNFTVGLSIESKKKYCFKTSV